MFAYYQARAGQQFTLEVGVSRLREYGLDRLGRLKRYLAEAGVESTGGDEEHGAFLTVRHPNASFIAKKLAVAHVQVDARGSRLDCVRTA